ncbi:HIT family protein [Amycolatopsis sp. DSM 110486]|uniref:HIT family protein n=1 Tax=Amycolatopsis sp. DSM 110486 TaxID=2865832 RepID=UPI001C6A03A4|nr:HIT domain-containing protein [Amycolatopsis sp. DSM 110486]QYN17461.1 HIT domain-containing protein [Amycolatopsis sp. DSM 110486]
MTAGAVAFEHGMTECVFCSRIEHGLFGRHDKWAVAFEPLKPVIRGRHILVVPRRHAPHAGADPDGAAVAMRFAATLAAEMGMDFNIITSAGPAATQTIEHTHLHVLLREPGDGITLPWTVQDRSDP